MSLIPILLKLVLTTEEFQNVSVHCLSHKNECSSFKFERSGLALWPHMMQNSTDECVSK